MPDVKHFDPDTVLDSVVRLFWRQGVGSTGVQDIVSATGLNRSSLYSTFGGKQELYVAALRHYVERRSEPVLRKLTDGTSGLAIVTEFFRKLIETRCSGEHARWGCLISNAHANGDGDDPDVREILSLHHDRLRAAMFSALERAEAAGQLRPEVSVASAADMLALLAYGVNLRSRAGADPGTLEKSVTAAIGLLAA
ncbi:TetR/AcrR family transcriptional regulator [Amycolatopsis orientalis]|uniref:TetR/AcrR family transcriptional regulator n=1 Tax=Amycolatopsis orientalis TaxID=31958 RepID=UPI0005654A30|nr:TetR/AcrR family transcriptional regulator [Amycolatopsis orientalis]